MFLGPVSALHATFVVTASRTRRLQLNLVGSNLSADRIRAGKGFDTHAAEPAKNKGVANLYDLIRPPFADIRAPNRTVGSATSAASQRTELGDTASPTKPISRGFVPTNFKLPLRQIKSSD